MRIWIVDMSVIQISGDPMKNFSQIWHCSFEGLDVVVAIDVKVVVGLRWNGHVTYIATKDLEKIF